MLSMQWHTCQLRSAITYPPAVLLQVALSWLRGSPATTRSVTDVVSASSLTVLETRCIIHI